MMAFSELAVAIGDRWRLLPGCCQWFLGCVGTAVILGVSGGVLGG
jgi:hypothetical protein